jgi:hypothetical protein
MFVAREHARVSAVSIGIAFAAGLLAGCSSDRIIQPSSDGEVSLPLSPGVLAGQSATGLGAPVPISFATYEKSNQVVHPSAVSFPSDWNGQRFWLAITPYPNSDSHVENPSLFASANGEDWSPPAGVINPLEQTLRGYLSDPDLVYDPAANELRLYYREVVETHRKHHRTKHEQDNVYLTRSADGVHWSAPLSLTTDRGRFVVSPAVARRTADDWKMWSVDAGRAGCNARSTSIVLRQSPDGIRWSEPVQVAFTQPGYRPWHLDVQWVAQRSEYWALIAAYPRRHTCTETSLFLATSSDGVNWQTYAAPVLARGVLPEFATNVYRSTFAFAPDGESLTIWLTGATTVQRGDRKHPPVLKWSAAVWHTQALALLTHVRAAPITVVPMATSPSFLRQLAVENALP